jgi:hypothetical protein
MIRSIAPWTLSALLLAPLCACEKPGATELQREERAKEQAADSINRSEQSVQNAQSVAQRDIASARADFDKSREDYRHDRQVKLADLDKKLAQYDAKATAMTAKAKTDAYDRLATLRGQREAFVADMQTLDSATPATWDATKDRVDREWDALKDAVDKGI